MKKIIAFLLLLPFFFAGCEKDDICDTSSSTTPRLVLKFYNKNNISVLRATTNLKIVGVGMGDNFLPNQSGGPTWNDTVVYIPLRVNENSTSYKLTLNADDVDVTNDKTDMLEINYRRNNVYISRACGFKTLYDLFGDPLKNAFVLNNTPNTVQGNWINTIEVVQSQINDENEAHIKILF